MPSVSENSKFCLSIDYVRDSEDPGRIFRGMSALIDSFTALDRILARTIDTRIEPILLLQDIQSGSIRTWLGSKLTMVDDRDIRDLNWKRIVGTFLLDAKYTFLHFRIDNPTLINRQQLVPLQNNIVRLAEQSQINHLPSVNPIPTEQLVVAYSQISSAVAVLNRQDKIEYITDAKSIELPRSEEMNEDDINALLASEIIHSSSTLILKVKKSDYLGQSKWLFKHGEHPIEAKITDTDWLIRFQSGEIQVVPGDSLRAEVNVANYYSEIGDVIRTTYELRRVLKVITKPSSSQMPLIDRSKN